MAALCLYKQRPLFIAMSIHVFRGDRAPCHNSQMAKNPQLYLHLFCQLEYFAGYKKEEKKEGEENFKKL